MTANERVSITGFEPNEKPWIGLAYLVFAYMPLVFMPSRSPLPLLATLFATIVFLPLYFSSFRRPRERSVLPWVLSVAAIGYALIPVNGGGHTFIIYALAMAAAGMRPRSAIALGAALMLATAIEFVLVIPQLRVALALDAVMLVIGSMVMAGILFARSREQQNAMLHLTQDEVRRLAAMAERERIGRDLHDLLGHTLSVVALKSELAGKLIERDPAAARVQIRDVENVAREALTQVREAVAGIRAAGLQVELASARLALLAADVRFDQRLAPIELDAQVEQVLAMAVREAITNIIRHADARRVEIELTQEDDAVLRLLIADDGRGGAERYGNGLTGMQERVAAVGGTLQVESARSAGTRVILRVPQHRKTGVEA